MAMQYINYIKAKTHIGLSSKSDQPVLTDEDENFLNRITSDNPAPLPRVEHGGDAQVALMDGAQNVALPPATPNELTEEPELTKAAEGDGKAKPRSTWSWLRRDSRDVRNETAEGLQSIADNLKAAEAEAEKDPEKAEAEKEEEEMTIMLDQLNLAAVNNRVFSISEDTQELLRKFNQILKDLMNGVPTAYHDLESLLTNGDKQLQKTFNNLPPFLQKLIEKLPESMTKGFAPEMMAAASERAAKSGINLEKAGKAAGAASSFMKAPSLHDLLGKPGMVTAMLKSIINFLKTRFPAFAGMNVLWSLALFILLFVFWYCHKRGKEVRLEKERDLTEHEVQELNKEWLTAHPGESIEQKRPSLSTTAPPGASLEEVKAGIAEAEAMRAAIAAQEVTENTTETETLEPEVAPPKPPRPVKNAAT